MEDDNKNVKKISNPLTMIGIFAGLAETAGAVVLPLIAEPYQKIFIWYVMGFPVLLVCLFFYVLIRHPENLYAPSDFKDEKIYERLRQRQLKATVALTTAILNKNPNKRHIKINEIADVVTKASSGLSATKNPHWKNQILWVDDNPDDNIYEREAFENVGYEFATALSTDEALGLLKDKKFAAIISDMGRKEGPREGYVLLEAVRNRGITTPFFIYSNSNLPEHIEEAHQRGAQGCACDPQELFSAVIDKIN